ncbi:unnamed protein product [Schistosoma turkestanicum]|nr:unnamed protein product [Schistosoma turkestanicum]
MVNLNPRIYSVDTKSHSVTSIERFSKFQEDPVVILQSYDKLIFSAHSSGRIGLFSHEFSSEKLQLKAPGLICSAKLAANQIVAGGKELALHVWDINNHSSPIFTAKNVRSSALELAVPTWIADVSFVPKSNGRLVLTASRYGEFDIYDLRCGQRRPVARHAWRTSRKHGKLHVGSGKHSAVLPDLATIRPITKAVAYDSSPGIGLRVVAGNAVGELSILDLRLPPEYSNLNSLDDHVRPVKSYGSRAPDPPSGVRCLAGASGCITQLICSGADDENTFPSMETTANNEPIVIASSLDRYLRVYNRDTGKRLGKIYTKVPVTSFLVTCNANFKNIANLSTETDDNCVTSNKAEKGDNSHGISETAQKEFDDLWNQIPIVGNDKNVVDVVDDDDDEGSKKSTEHKISKRKRKK